MNPRVFEDPDELGYRAGGLEFDPEELVEECLDCDGEGMRIEANRQLFICDRCGGDGVLPHACS